MKKAFFGLLALTLAGMMTVSCLKPSKTTITYTVYVPKSYTTFFLNTGVEGVAEASVTAFNPNTKEVKENFIKQEEIGGIAEDIYYFNKYIYLTIPEEKAICRYSADDGSLREKRVFDDVKPLWIISDGKDLYVSCTGGKLLKLDATTFADKAEALVLDEDVDLGSMAGYSNTLYVAGKDKIYLVNISNFTKGPEQTCPEDPQMMRYISDGIYMIAGKDEPKLHRLTGSDKVIAPAKAFASYSDYVFFGNGSKMGVYVPSSDNTQTDVKFSNMPDITGKDVTLVATDPVTGYFYVAAVDNQYAGTIYRMDTKLAYDATVDAHGYNPRKVAFILDIDGYYDAVQVTEEY